MPGTRDPYYEWLGIPPRDQPPNHYRFLGLEIFEENRDVIAAAADRQMSFVKSYQCGEDSELSQRILNELSAARLRLLNPEKKAAYDTELRSEIEPLHTGESTDMAETSGMAPWVELEQAQPVSSHATHVSAPMSGQPRMMAIVISIAVACVLGGVAVGLLLLRTWGRGSSSNEGVVQHEEKIPPALGSGSETDVPKVVENKDDSTVEGSTPVAEESSAVDERLPGPAPVAVSEPREPEDLGLREPEEPTMSTEPGKPVKPMPEAPAAELVPQTEPVALPKRQQAPDTELQQRIIEEIAEVYDLGPGTSRIAKKRQYEEFLEFARDPKETQDRRFVLLRLATQLACETGDTAGMLETVDEIGAGYEVRTIDLKAKMLAQMLGPADSPTKVMAFLKASQDVVIEAARADEYEIAHGLSSVAVGLCDRNVGGTDFRQGIRDRHAELERLRHEYEQAQVALQTLEEDDGSPAAHLTAGRWLCFVKNDWDHGLLHLARGSDTRLREIAERELQGVVDGSGQIALAELWRELALEADEKVEHALLCRARHWYKQANPATLAGIRRAQAEQRVVEIDERIGALRPGSICFFDEPSSGIASDAASEARSQDLPSLFSRGLTAAVQERDFQIAARLFGRCAELDPELVPALNNYALASLRSGNARRAIHLWENACELAPRTESVAHNLSLLSQLASSGRVKLDTSARKSIDTLLSAAGGHVGILGSTFGFLFMPLDGGRDTSARYLDQACIYCNGLGHIPCPVRACSRGSVGSTRTDTIGRSPVTGQAILKVTPIRIPCSQCRGKGAVDCTHCSNGTMTRVR